MLHKAKVSDLPAATAHQDSVYVAKDQAGTRATPQAYFDRGMFHVPVHGHVVSFALMPPYLRTLTFSREFLEARPGWDLTRRAYREMKRTADQHDAKLVVMYIPFKSQLYLPLLQRVFPAEELNRHFKFYFRENQADPDVSVMAKNRFSQNEMMRDLCAEYGIPFLDLTQALQHQVDQGNAVYFPDDAHWNSAGHDLAARELAAFLRQHHMDSAQ
jgi:hypothetical protein